MNDRKKYPAYPSFAGKYGNYVWNPDAAYSSCHLGANSFPVVHPSNPVLKSLGEELGTLIAGMYTPLQFAPEVRDKTFVVPHEGSFEEGASWLTPHLQQFNMVSFDTESSVQGNLGTSFAIFGAADGYVLIADLRQQNTGTLPPCLGRLLRNKLVLGSNVRADIASSGGNIQYTGDTKFLSGWVQRHRLSPYPVYRSKNGDYRLGLKHLPELIFGVHYGPLKSLPSKDAKGRLKFLQPEHIKRFPQPYPWPVWHHATKIYNFSAKLPSTEQIAYMRNDGCSPFIHLMFAAMLMAADGDVNPGAANVRNALLVTAESLFATLPDTWEAVHGLPRNLSDEDLLCEIRRLPSDSLRTIEAYDCFLDLEENGEDQAFIELHGGLKTIKRIHDMLQANPGLLPGSQVEAEGEEPAETVVSLTIPAEEEPVAPPAPSGHSVPSTSTPLKRPAGEDSGFQDEHNHASGCKRRRYEFTICSCPHMTPEVRPIPLEDIPLPASEPPDRVVRPVMWDKVVGESRQVRLPSMLDVLAGRVSLGEGNPDIKDAIRPPRFTGAFSTHYRCQVCGARAGPKHVATDCPTFRAFKTSHWTPDQEWTRTPCEYELCSDNKSHFTKACPHLHALCLTCGYRGHGTERCRAVQMRTTLPERETMFHAVALKGMSTRKGFARTIEEGGSAKKAKKKQGSKGQRGSQAAHPVERRVVHAPAQPEWGFHPVIPSLTVVSYDNKCYLVTWTDEQVVQFFSGDDQLKKNMLFDEFDR